MFSMDKSKQIFSRFYLHKYQSVAWMKRKLTTFMSRRNRNRLASAATNSIIVTIILALVGYIAVEFEIGGSIGQAMRLFSKASQQDIRNLEQIMQAYQQNVDERGEFYTRVNTKISELMTDVLEDSGSLNIQSGLITLSADESEAINHAIFYLSVGFVNKFDDATVPVVNLRWKNLIPGEPIPGLRLQGITREAFSLAAGGPGATNGRPGRVQPGAQIYWTAVGSFPGDGNGLRKLRGPIRGTRPARMERIIPAPKELEQSDSEELGPDPNHHPEKDNSEISQ